MPVKCKQNSVIGVNWDFPACSAVKDRPANTGDTALVPGQKDPLEMETAYPLQYSCLENPMDRGSWWATVHGVTKSWTRLSD